MDHIVSQINPAHNYLKAYRNFPLFIKQNVQYSVHSSPTMDHIVSQINPVHTYIRA